MVQEHLKLVIPVLYYSIKDKTPTVSPLLRDNILIVYNPS